MKKLDELVGEGGDHVPEELKGKELATRAAGDNTRAPGLTLGVLSRSVCPHGRTSALSGRDLEVLVEKTIRNTLAGSGPLEPIIDYLMSGQGKFLRPKLVIWSAGACGSTFRGGFPSRDNDKTVVAEIGAACEMIHMASLVHDDVIDGASMRRGLPAVHVLWGVHSAILAGDYLFAKANGLALRYASLGIDRLLNMAVELMCQGEVFQDNRLFDPTVTEQDYFYQVSRKTAALMAAACKAGAFAGGAPQGAAEALWLFGMELGVAFQIVDDILDILSDEKTLGKPIFNDLRRGTLTLPLIFGMKTELKEDILRCFELKEVPHEVAARVRQKLREYGCIDRAKEIVGELTDSAQSRLEILSPSESKSMLLNLAKSIKARVDQS